MIYVQKFTFNPFMENTYVLYDSSKECVIIDPGCFTNEEEQILSNFISENKLNPVMLWHTHSHLDHMFGSSYIMNTYNIHHTYSSSSRNSNVSSRRSVCM